MIEIFKTNARTKAQATEAISLLNSLFPDVQANFDLQDCDKILRLQGIKTGDLPIVKKELARLGLHCAILI